MIRLLLLVFPPGWRRRYGNELVELVSDVGLGWRAALDLVAAGLRERGRQAQATFYGGSGMVIGPAWRHPNRVALLALAVLAPTLTFVLGSLLAYQMGVDTLRMPMESVNQWLAGRMLVDLALVLSPALAVLLAVAPLVRLELRDGDAGRKSIVRIRLRAANVAIAATALAIGALLAWHILAESLVATRA